MASELAERADAEQSADSRASGTANTDINGIRFLVAAHLLQLGFLIWVAATARFCCDATDYYIPAGQALFHDGLLWHDTYAGYRFYFVPLIFGALEKLLTVVLPAHWISIGLPFALAILFWIASTGSSIYAYRRVGLRRWFMWALPLLFNPFLLALVPYPLQESVVVISCVPLLFLLLSVERSDFRLTCVLGVLFAGLAFAARSSLVWVAAPTILFLMSELMRTTPKPMQVLQALAAGTAVLLLLIAPQCYISWHDFGTLNPLAKWNVATSQVRFGIEMFNYSTVYDAHGFGGFPIWSPYHHLPDSLKTINFYWTHPAAGFLLAATHVWSGLHFVALTPYVSVSSLTVASPWLIISSTVVACGVLGMVRTIRKERGAAILLAGLLLGSCAYTAFVATESRFGLFGFAALSAAASTSLFDRSARPFLLRCLPLVCAYVVLCLMFNGLLLSRTATFWPGGSDSPGASRATEALDAPSLADLDFAKARPTVPTTSPALAPV